MSHPQFDQIPRDYSELERRVLGKTVSYMIFDDFIRLVKQGQRSLRNRHHKRKEQPNCGPRKPNQW